MGVWETCTFIENTAPNNLVKSGVLGGKVRVLRGRVVSRRFDVALFFYIETGQHLGDGRRAGAGPRQDRRHGLRQTLQLAAQTSG